MRHILIATDNAEIAQFVKQDCVDKRVCRVPEEFTTTHSGVECLTKLSEFYRMQKRPYDLVVCSRTLSDMTSDELIQRIRHDSTHKDYATIPIINITRIFPKKLKEIPREQNTLTGEINYSSAVELSQLYEEMVRTKLPYSTPWKLNLQQ